MSDDAKSSAARNLVLASIETGDGDRCVDIFRRVDGTFGFEGYRRDVEALTGWFATASCGDARFKTAAAARAAAARVFPWVPEQD